MSESCDRAGVSPGSAEEKPCLMHCTATVDGATGFLSLRHLYAGNAVEGRESCGDEDVRDWTDDQIQSLVANLIGCNDEDQDTIRVER